MNSPLKRARDRLQAEFYWRARKHEIRRRGWSGIPLCDDEGLAGWTYTVGFDETLGHPELVIGAIMKPMTDALFARAYDAIARGELVIQDGLAWELCGQARYVWRKVHPSRITDDRFLFAMLRRYERGLTPRGLHVFQLVTPDPFGVLPWEPGYLEDQRRYTPELWRPAAERRADRRMLH